MSEMTDALTVERLIEAVAQWLDQLPRDAARSVNPHLSYDLRYRLAAALATPEEG